jgi:hypothetical protein
VTIAVLAMAILTLSCGVLAEETDKGDSCGINGHIVSVPFMEDLLQDSNYPFEIQNVFSFSQERCSHFASQLVRPNLAGRANYPLTICDALRQ